VLFGLFKLLRALRFNNVCGWFLTKFVLCGLVGEKTSVGGVGGKAAWRCTAGATKRECASETFRFVDCLCSILFVVVGWVFFVLKMSFFFFFCSSHWLRFIGCFSCREIACPSYIDIIECFVTMYWCDDRLANADLYTIARRRSMLRNVSGARACTNEWSVIDIDIRVVARQS
jgi:hypothetical protein